MVFKVGCEASTHSPDCVAEAFTLEIWRCIQRRKCPQSRQQHARSVWMKHRSNPRLEIRFDCDEKCEFYEQSVVSLLGGKLLWHARKLRLAVD